MSLLEYFKVVATTKIPFESDTLTRLMQSDYHVTPHKRRRIEPGMPPEKEDRDIEGLHDYIQGWFQHINSWSYQMVKEVYHLNSEIFKVCIRLGTPCTLYGKQLSKSWGRIKLVHERSQYLTHSLTTTVKTLGRRCEKSNKRESDA